MLAAAVTVIATVSAGEGSEPSFTTRLKTSTASAAPATSTGAVKPGVAVAAPLSVTAGPELWLQA